jgi:ribosomal protein L11 methylase PrmA
MGLSPHPSSFKDPDGAIFTLKGEIYRYVFESYKPSFDFFISSGLYNDLMSKDLLVPHTETDPTLVEQAEKKIYRVLKPQIIPFISYPYEWCFEQLKLAALLTLEIQLSALEKGMSLKDATAYNVQFAGTKPVFIDTLSFEIYEDNKPWQAYGQFCRHFLGPLLLWVYGKHEVANLNLKYPDGIPLNVISYSLPFKTKFNFSIFSHIHYHSKLEKKLGSNASKKLKDLRLGKTRLIAILTHLKNYISQLKAGENASPWVNYYETFSYSDAAFKQKKTIVEGLVKELSPANIIDIGCNDGEFSLLCAENVQLVVSVDSDASVVNNLYNKASGAAIGNILPLVVDITNPSPGTGLNNQERTSFLKRGNFDMVLALALLHHVTIGNNVPFELFAKQLSEIASSLIIEFVPKEDQQAQRLLVTRKDIFTDYHLQGFTKAFGKFFVIRQQIDIGNTGRKLFLMQKHA